MMPFIELFFDQQPWTLFMCMAVGIGVTILTSLVGWVITQVMDLGPTRKRASLASRGNEVIVLACGTEAPSISEDSPMRAKAEKFSPDTAITWIHCDNFGQQIKATDALIGLHSRTKVGALIVLSPLSLFRQICEESPTLGHDFSCNWLRQLGRCTSAGDMEVPCFGLAAGASPGDASPQLLALHPSRGWGIVPPEFRLFDADSDTSIPAAAAKLLYALGLPKEALGGDTREITATSDLKKER